MPTITAIPYQSNTETLFDQIKDLPYACWLDSGKPYSEDGRYDIISAIPHLRLVTEGKLTQIFERDRVSQDERLIDESKDDPLVLVKQALSQLSSSKNPPLPFSGGAIGYFGYDLSQHYIPTERPETFESPLPDMHIGIYHWAIVQDHQEQTAQLIFLPECHPEIIDLVQHRLDKPCEPEHREPLKVKGLSPCISRDEYLKQLQKINQYILAGDCYQVNFAQCFKGDYSGSPYLAYAQLRKKMASPFSAYLDIGDQAILSLSPERFLQTRGRQVLTQPIKGTAARHPQEAIDKENARELQASEKNRAENLMIVDLLRNDLGHHCVPGSIEVSTLFGLQSFPNVHHLVSDIIGELAPEASSIELLRDCFPGGSITGAPKKRAMEIISELENRNRNVYCGSVGYISANGDMDTNIAIRTISCDGQSLYCWGGGGIVADSNPEDEYQESLDKITAILDVLESRS